MGFTPGKDRLAIRLPGAARFLAGRLLGGRGQSGGETASEPPPQGRIDAAAPPPAAPSPVAPAFAAPAVQGGAGVRIMVPMLRLAPEVEGWSRVISAHAAMAAQGRWDEVLAALRAADAGRQSLPGGKRLAELISQGARGGLAAAIARRDIAAAQAELAGLEAVFAAHPDDYVAAHLLAQGHLDLGWALRGETPGEDMPRTRWQSFLDHTARAEAVLEPFDPLECYSPLLAATRYLLVRGLDDGGDLCRDWYEDWSDLDPTNWTVHATHAPHLLPQWYGSIRGFDQAARDAAARTGDRMGAAAYAMFYMAAADSLGDLPPFMDLALLLRGLKDFRAETACQYRANIVGGVLAQIAHVLYLEGPAAEDRLALVQAALHDLATAGLREFHLPAWEMNESCIRWAMEQAFGAVLTPGCRIVVGEAGLVLLPG